MENKMKKGLLIAGIVIILVLFAVGLFFLINPGKSRKELFTDAIEKGINNLVEMNNKESQEIILEKLLTGKMGNVKISSDTDVLFGDSEEAEEMYFNGEIYYNDMQAYANLLLDGNFEQPLNLEAILKDSKLYHKINNVYSRFYFTELDFSDFMLQPNNNVNNKFDSSIILDYLLEALDENITDEILEEVEKEITLSNAKIKTKKLTANFTEKRALKLLKTFMEKLTNNQEFYNLINGIIIENSKDVDNLDSLIDELDYIIDEANDKDTLFSYSVYLDDDIVVSNEVALSVDSEDTTVNIKFVINSYTDDDEHEIFETYLSVMGLKMIKFKVEAINDSKAKFEMSIYNTMDVEGKFETTNKETKMEINATTKVYQDDGTTEDEELLNAVISLKEVEKDKEYNFDLDCSVNYLDTSLTIDSSNKFTIVDEIPDIDLSDSKDISEMKDDERLFFEEIFG